MYVVCFLSLSLLIPFSFAIQTVGIFLHTNWKQECVFDNVAVTGTVLSTAWCTLSSSVSAPRHTYAWALRMQFWVFLKIFCILNSQNGAKLRFQSTEMRSDYHWLCSASQLYISCVHKPQIFNYWVGKITSYLSIVNNAVFHFLTLCTRIPSKVILS